MASLGGGLIHDARDARLASNGPAFVADDNRTAPVRRELFQAALSRDYIETREADRRVVVASRSIKRLRPSPPNPPVSRHSILQPFLGVVCFSICAFMLFMV